MDSSLTIISRSSVHLFRHLETVIFISHNSFNILVRSSYWFIFYIFFIIHSVVCPNNKIQYLKLPSYMLIPISGLVWMINLNLTLLEFSMFILKATFWFEHQYVNMWSRCRSLHCTNISVQIWYIAVHCYIFNRHFHFPFILVFLVTYMVIVTVD